MRWEESSQILRIPLFLIRFMIIIIILQCSFVCERKIEWVARISPYLSFATLSLADISHLEVLPPSAPPPPTLVHALLVRVQVWSQPLLRRMS